MNRAITAVRAKLASIRAAIRQYGAQGELKFGHAIGLARSASST
jgi:hypothetical protein